MKSFSIIASVAPLFLVPQLFSSDLVSASSNLRRRSTRHDANTTRSTDTADMWIEDHPVVLPPGYTNSTGSSTHRRLASASGTRTLLIIRVIASGRGPSVSATQLRSAAFGRSNSLASQLRDCSAGKLNVVEKGIVDLNINANPSDVRELISVSQRDSGKLGLGDIKRYANHVAFVFPELGSSYVAEAEIVGSYSWYNNKLAISHSVLVHEVGHNFGLDHAGITRDEYGDYSGMMGRSTTTVGGPAMCYNAADHYRLGWFQSKRLDVGRGPRTVTVGAFVDSTSTPHPVVVRAEGNIYFQYNLAQKHNAGTRAMANQLVIVKLLSNGHTEVQKGLLQGQSWRDPNTGVTYQVCGTGSRTMTVSVNSGCGTSSNNNYAAPNPSPPASNWGNSWGNVPRPAPVFNIAPRPNPVFSIATRPTPTSSFNIFPSRPTGQTPSWGKPNVFNSVFSNNGSKPTPTTNWSSWSPGVTTPSRSSSTWSFTWAGASTDDNN